MQMGRKRKDRPDLPRRVYFNHGAYFFVDRTGKWVPLGRHYEKAMMEYARINQPGEITTMGGIMDRYMQEIAPKKAPRTYKNNILEIKRLRAVFSPMRPDDVTPQDVYAYMDARGKPIAANREKSLLSHIFSCAIRWGLTSHNPCKLVKRNTERPRDRYVEDWEYQALKSIAPPMIGHAMDLAHLTGLRLGDILRIKLHDIKPDGLYIVTGKTGKKMHYELTPELSAVIDAAKAIKYDVRSLALICNREGSPYTVSGFESVWQKLMRKAVAQELIKERFTFHDIRAKSGTESDNATELLGHDDPRTTNRHYKRGYRKVTPIKPKIFGNGQ